MSGGASVIPLPKSKKLAAVLRDRRKKEKKEKSAMLGRRKRDESST